jgi:hypothetical protein
VLTYCFWLNLLKKLKKLDTSNNSRCWADLDYFGDVWMMLR